VLLDPRHYRALAKTPTTCRADTLVKTLAHVDGEGRTASLPGGRSLEPSCAPEPGLAYSAKGLLTEHAGLTKSFSMFRCLTGMHPEDHLSDYISAGIT
jgi:hypothetical protein